MSRSNVLILLAYVILISALMGGLFAARWRILGQQPEGSRQDWQQWRQEAARQATGHGPVTRRIPAATEAPTVLLLRDHFAACLTLTLVISTVLYATLAFMIRGVLFGPQTRPHPDPRPDPRPLA